MKVYLVTEASGYVYAIFTSKEDAEFHAKVVNEQRDWPVNITGVVERTLHYGQAPNKGYNE